MDANSPSFNSVSRGRLLVSVRSVDEALLALSAQVAVIDVKEPRSGSLGAAAPGVIGEILNAVGGRCPVSAACGELSDQLPSATFDARLGLAKFGLAGCRTWPNWQARLWRTIDTLPSSTAAVAVIYADWQACGAPNPAEVLELACHSRFAAVLVDTFNKSRGGLFAHLNEAAVAEIVVATRAAKKMSVLAGSLDRAALPRALALGADLVAVRGCICHEDRTGAIDPLKLAEIAELVRECPPLDREYLRVPLSNRV